MKYKVKDTFNEETLNSILRTIEIARKCSEEALIDEAKYSSDHGAVVELAKDVRAVRLTGQALGYKYVSYAEIDENQD